MSTPPNGAVRVRVDVERCTGHARCNAVAPAVFPLDDDGFCRVTETLVSGDLERGARDGAGACPERAITVGD